MRLGRVVLEVALTRKEQMTYLGERKVCLWDQG